MNLRMTGSSSDIYIMFKARYHIPDTNTALYLAMLEPFSKYSSLVWYILGKVGKVAKIDPPCQTAYL
jgi:hypothetical protein